MPYRVLEATRLNSVTVKMVLEERLIARKARAGQFVVLRVDEKGERIPLTVHDSDPARGTLTIIFQEVGRTTKKLAQLHAGDSVADLIGPLGRASGFGLVGDIVFVAGGVGIAEALPVVRYAKACGNRATCIIGARTQELLILEDEMKRACDRLFAATDDGSRGRRGLVTDVMRELLGKESFGLAYCVGPDVMMKAVCEMTRPYGLKTLVSLDANMVDATGMCGTCRVTVGGKVLFTCVDGPEFNGHFVDWDEFLKRQKRFSAEEKSSLEFPEHRCGMVK